MKLMLSLLRRPAALASLLLAMAVPATGYSADQSTPTRRIQAPVGTPIQPVNYNCPNGDCHDGGRPGWGWGGGWGGSCSTCNGGGLFGCGCHHGSASGHSWVRPPATWPLARTSNMYPYYWSPRLAGVAPVAPPGGMQFPMVYQPTDTTQMGYYYRSVPRWDYRPEMLPPAPAPNWPLGMNSVYGAGWVSNGWGAPVYAPATAPAVNAPVTPVPGQAPVVAPPPPAEPQVNVPEPEATFFPNRARR